MTHDVDSIKRPLTHVLRRARRFKFTDLLKHILGLTNLYNNIPDVMELEEKFGLRSTFFIPVQLFPVDEIVDLVKELVTGGWEVQLHYVYEPNQPEALFRMQRQYFEWEFNVKVWGVRVHGLVINDRLLDLFEQEGLIYDSTYRAEQVRRYSPFRIRGRLVELPIGVMDTDLFGRLQMREDKALRYVLEKIEDARALGEGTFVLLFHQESYRMRGGRIYSKILEELVSRGYTFSRCVDVAQKFQESLKLEK